MNRSFLLPLLALLLAAPALAQEDGPYVYASYSVCEPATVAAADAAFTGSYVPALNAHVSSGDISAWGHLTHSDGGVWTRGSYTVAPTLDALMAFQDTWQDEISRDHAAARTAIRTSCTQHVDYIWRVVASSALGEAGRNRAPFGGSIYMQCGQGGLDRADALFREAFAPNLDAMVRDGAISRWGWQAHVIGGQFTRALILDTASPIATLHAIERLGDGADGDALAEFNALCPTHQDYIWGVTSSR